MHKYHQRQYSIFQIVSDSLQDESEALNENVIEVKGLEESMERAGNQKRSHLRWDESNTFSKNVG